MAIDKNNKRWRLVLAMIWIQSKFVITDIIVKPVNTEVKVGETTYFNCSTSEPSGGILWLHYPVGKGTAHDMRHVYSDGKLYDPYDKRFQIETDHTSGAFNLVIRQTEVQDAGLYVCQNGDDRGQSAELIVLESLPSCSSNIDARGLVGPNSCGIQRDMIGLSCNINYAGNIHPMLQWTKQKGNQLFVIPESCSSTGRSVTCNYTAEANRDLDGYSFICETSRPKNARYSCKTETVTILSGRDNRPRTPTTVGDVVTCPIPSSSYDCNYTWIWYDGDNEETASQSSTLEVRMAGLHRCEAKCHFRQFTCNFAIMSIESSVGSLTNFNTTALIVGIVLGSIILFLVVCLVKRLTRRNTDYDRSTPIEIAVVEVYETDEMKGLNKPEDKAFNEEAEHLLEPETSCACGHNEDALETTEVKNIDNDEPNPVTQATIHKSEVTHPGIQDLKEQDCDGQPRWPCDVCTFNNPAAESLCIICNRANSL